MKEEKHERFNISRAATRNGQAGQLWPPEILANMMAFT